jgi:hypothetical protein
MSASRRESVDDLVHEIDLMRGFHHPNIVEYIGASVNTHKYIYSPTYVSFNNFPILYIHMYIMS